MNAFQDWTTFVQLSLIGLTRGSLYALVALGYTLVYGILELINFAHGDVFMIGGMIAATFALDVFDLGVNPAFGPLMLAILVALVVAMVGCGLLNASIERVAYRAAAAGTAARAADHCDRRLVHPPGRRR